MTFLTEVRGDLKFIRTNWHAKKIPTVKRSTTIALFFSVSSFALLFLDLRSLFITHVILLSKSYQNRTHSGKANCLIIYLEPFLKWSMSIWDHLEPVKSPVRLEA